MDMLAAPAYLTEVSRAKRVTTDGVTQALLSPVSITSQDLEHFIYGEVFVFCLLSNQDALNIEGWQHFNGNIDSVQSITG
jgi:hypothetical protein